MSDFIEPKRPQGHVVKLGNIIPRVDGFGGELWVDGNGALYRVTTVFGDHDDWRAWDRLPATYLQQNSNILQK
jgi:hypothetical protein